MKAFLYICALLLAIGGIFSCRTAQPQRSYTRAEGTPLTQPYTPVLVKPDSSVVDSVVVTPHRSLVDKVLGRHLPPLPPPTTSPLKGRRVQVGKKSTVNIYYGPATVTTSTVGKKATAATAEGATATNIGKAKGPTAIGDSATATDNTKAGQRGGAAATAPGATATATTEKSGIPWWLWAGAAVVVVYVGYRKFSTL